MPLFIWQLFNRRAVAFGGVFIALNKIKAKFNSLGGGFREVAGSPERPGNTPDKISIFRVFPKLSRKAGVSRLISIEFMREFNHQSSYSDE
jgi:hypothetical protein